MMRKFLGIVVLFLILISNSQAFTMKGIDEVMNFWKASNRCNDAPAVIILPDLTDDGLSGSIATYTDCQNDAEVVLYLLEGLAHRWPLQNEADLDAPTTIWHFLSRHNLYGKIF